jgi:hypothetical protein
MKEYFHCDKTTSQNKGIYSVVPGNLNKVSNYGYRFADGLINNNNHTENRRVFIKGTVECKH